VVALLLRQRLSPLEGRAAAVGLLGGAGAHRWRGLLVVPLLLVQLCGAKLEASTCGARLVLPPLLVLLPC
jgi:hypothetical protein